MKSFLVMLMVLTVSGDDKETITVTGCVDEVLLPCSCSKRDLREGLRWQMESPREAKVFVTTSEATSDFNDTYKGRAKIFVTEDNYNCSLLLTNITAADQGRYRCSFKNNGQYKRYFVHLNISSHCAVKPEGRSTILNNSCFKTESLSTDVPPTCFKLYVKVIPIVLVIGVSLILLCRWKLSKRTRTVETYHSCC